MQYNKAYSILGCMPWKIYKYTLDNNRYGVFVKLCQLKLFAWSLTACLVPPGSTSKKTFYFPCNPFDNVISCKSGYFCKDFGQICGYPCKYEKVKKCIQYKKVFKHGKYVRVCVKYSFQYVKKCETKNGKYCTQTNWCQWPIKYLSFTAILVFNSHVCDGICQQNLTANDKNYLV